MTLIETLHQFCGQMSYGYDPGFTQIWLTPMLYRKLCGEFEGRPNWDVLGWEPPPFIDFEGRRIFCGEATRQRSRIKTHAHSK